MTELKPCPFCGSEVEIVEQDNYYLHFFFVHCANDNCPNTVETDAYPTEAEAVEAWNTRVERTCEMEPVWATSALQCSECRAYVSTWDAECEIGKINYCPCCGRKVVER